MMEIEERHERWAQSSIKFLFSKWLNTFNLRSMIMVKQKKPGGL